jgi:thiamine-phosphate pyrophosphorylase
LYAICDLDFLAKRSLDPVRYAQALMAAQPAALQIRAKRAPVSVALQLLRELRPSCMKQRTLLFANDRADVAVLAECDGVHVGQTDLPLADVRRFDAALGVGISTHSLAQLQVALSQRPSYVAFGPVFATESKENPDAVQGVQRLFEAATLARAAQIPLVAIGGIRAHHCPELAARVDAVAIISGLCPAPDEVVGEAQTWSAITRRAAAIQAAFAQP